MKTTDLIPLILLELKGEDKYGLEITKSIEKRSSSRIKIKQPTLYTILKKLEKSKFITSYWLDSAIGGKRHYYKITQNGKMQAATYPNYNEVMRQILETEDVKNTKEEPVKHHTSHVKRTTANSNVEQLSILDALVTEPIETIIPTQEVFALDNIDNATSTELNQQNSKILLNAAEKKDERFASNNEVKRFTEKPENKISNEYKEQLKAIYSSTNKKYNDIDTEISTVNYNSIKYVDYVDLKNDAKYIYGKKTAKSMFYRVMCTCIYLLLAIILTSIPVRFVTNPSVYYISLIISVLCLIFYPTILAFNYQSFRLKCEDKPFKFNTRRQLLISSIVLFIVIVLFLLLNLTMTSLSFKAVFAAQNFANFYSPIIVATTMYADVLFAHLFLIKSKK